MSHRPLALESFSCQTLSMRRLTHIVVLAAFVFSCGGQWYALQCVAWVKMLHDYSQMVPFTQAVSMTFSGQYPCEICKALAEKKQAENDKICSLSKYDKKFFPPVAAELPLRIATSIHYAVYLSSLQFLTEPPPTPPPRQALA
jgi:hypothetical protein